MVVISGNGNALEFSSRFTMVGTYPASPQAELPRRQDSLFHQSENNGKSFLVGLLAYIYDSVVNVHPGPLVLVEM